MVPNSPSPHGWQVRPGKQVRLPAVMAILNATPDSFFAGSRDLAGEHIAEAIRVGAVILDIGPESTRPGSAPVSEAAQIDRAVPLIKISRFQDSKIPITIDTTRAAVARAALDAGADAINDQSAGTDDSGMLALAAERRCGIVLMHRVAPPARDKYSDQYAGAPMGGDVVAEVCGYLKQRAEAAIAAGIAREAIVLDPGLGFGKTVEQNMELIRRTGEIAALGFPVMSGLSRKSFVGRVSLGRDSTPEERLSGTLALSAAHLLAGASILRVHDVREHVELVNALKGFSLRG